MPSPDSQPFLSRHRTDAAVAGALFVIALGLASWYVPFFSASGGTARYYQDEFGAAVMEACGFGFVNPDELKSPALTAFLSRSRDQVACDELTAPPYAPLRPMQRAFRYLMLTVAETWRVRGQVAWTALTPLFALLYGITVVLAYAIFRQGMGVPLAAVAASLITVSTLHLNNLPHLRDYAKAPFVLALVLIAMRLVSAPVTRRRTLILAAAAGAIAGIGMGFRNDVLVAIPAFVVLFAVFLPAGWRARLGLRLAAVIVFLATLSAAMFPMLSVYNTGGGSSSQHLVLLGLTPGFSRDLGVNNSRLYEWGFEYRDELALAMIDNYSDRRLGRHEFLPMYGADYDRAASRYLLDIAAEFPADLLSRVYASAIRITELPYSTTTSALMAPPHVEGRLRAVFDARNWIVRQLAAIWPYAFGVTLFALTLYRVQLGVFAALFVCYLSAYPALQFQERHFFHLEFVAWWALGFTISLLVRFARGWRFTPQVSWRASSLRAASVWLIAALLIGTPPWWLRRYQLAHGMEVVTSMQAAPRSDVVDPSALPARLIPDDGVHAEYLVADIGGAQCDQLQVDITVRYDALNPNYDFSHVKTVRVPLANEPLELFIPAYFRSPASTDPLTEPFGFRGLELSGNAAPCLVRLSRVDHPESIPVLMEMRLPPDWKRATPYATITGVEGRENPHQTYAFPSDLSRHRFQRALAHPSAPFAAGDVKTVSRTLTMDGASWRVAGAGGVGGRGPLLYLVEMKDRFLKKHTAFVAEGRVDKGGVTFGLVKGIEWIVQLHVRQTGPFSVVIEVPEDGTYRVIMANHLIGMSLDNRVTVSRAGLVAPESLQAP